MLPKIDSSQHTNQSRQGIAFWIFGASAGHVGYRSLIGDRWRSISRRRPVGGLSIVQLNHFATLAHRRMIIVSDMQFRGNVYLVFKNCFFKLPAFLKNKILLRACIQIGQTRTRYVYNETTMRSRRKTGGRYSIGSKKVQGIEERKSQRKMQFIAPRCTMIQSSLKTGT